MSLHEISLLLSACSAGICFAAALTAALSDRFDLALLCAGLVLLDVLFIFI